MPECAHAKLRPNAAQVSLNELGKASHIRIVASRVLIFNCAWFRGNRHKSCHAQQLMNVTMLIKMVFVTAIFLLLVLMGVHNRALVDFNLPPLVSQGIQQPAALMYFAFFAVGLVTGAVLNTGRSKQSEKPNKLP